MVDTCFSYTRITRGAHVKPIRNLSEIRIAREEVRTSQPNICTILSSVITIQLQKMYRTNCE
jgi:hypothetical protein